MKILGCCTLCDGPIFEVTEQYGPGSHPLAGKPRRVGMPLDGTKRVTLLLANGNRTDVTLCEECEVTAENLPRIHQRLRESWAYEGTNGKRENLGAMPLDLEQQWVTGRCQLSEVDNVPIGILYQEPWVETIAREGR